MKVSVIIPVYNAEKYIRCAVESALQQKECGEIILVDDKSTDDSVKVCKSLAKEYEKVNFYRHDDNQNKGPGPSRNLGVLKARFDYIAFLDADDIYLPDRFKKAAELLVNNNDLDGVYEPVVATFESEEARRRYLVHHKGEVAMVSKKVKPEELFECLVSGKYGYISPDGLVLKKKAFLKVGMYPDLRLHEDTILIFKLAMTCRLVPGYIDKPVSARLCHLSNTITKPGIDFIQSYFLYLYSLLEWMEENKIERKRILLVKTKYYSIKYQMHRREGKFLSAIFFYVKTKLLSKITAIHKL